MAERMKQNFSAFRATLKPAQQATWDAELAAAHQRQARDGLQLVDGKPEAVTVRIGASDGTRTEMVGGELAEGDLVIIGSARPNAMSRAPLIQTHDLRKVYSAGTEAEVVALRGVNLRDRDAASSSRSWAPSGSGKSTLMNMIGCLDKPSAGSYLCDGVDVASARRRGAGEAAPGKDRLRVPGLQPALAHGRACTT